MKEKSAITGSAPAERPARGHRAAGRGGVLRFPRPPGQDEGLTTAPGGGAEGPGVPLPLSGTPRAPAPAAADPSAAPAPLSFPAQAGHRPGPARWRPGAGALSFLLVVVAPVVLSAWYLWAVAADQYVAHAGFSVRQDQTGARPDLAAALAGLSRASSTDTDILRAFIRSREMAARAEGRLAVSTLWAGAPRDRILAYRGTAREDLARYWRRMVQVSHDPGTGLIVLGVHAFAPGDALAIAEIILEESERLINTLSDAARAEAMALARTELEGAEARLRAARGALAAARAEARLLDPLAEAAARATLLAGLEAQLTEALVAADLLRATTRPTDPRLAREERRIAALRARIADERGRVAIPRAETEDYATLLARFERLELDRDVAEEAWRAALLAREAALAEARRQSRHLAVHERPALPERPEAPRRVQLLAMVALSTFLVWAVSALVWLSLRDRA